MLRTVGLIGEGEMGVRGSGDLVTEAGGAVGTESMSLGLAARASMLAAIQGSVDYEMDREKIVATCVKR